MSIQMSPCRRASSPASAAAASPDPALPPGDGNARMSPGSSSAEETGEGRWSALVPELLEDIMRRVHAGTRCWPWRHDVLSCASVCRSWREAAAVACASECGVGITFLPSLMQPGPKDALIPCFIRRDKEKTNFNLYLSLIPAYTNQGKFLLVARRIKSRLCTEYIISTHPDDLSRGKHVGKIKSDFLRRKFTFYDQQPASHREAAKVPRSRSSCWLSREQGRPRVSTGNVESGEVSYECNLLKSRRKRRIRCTIQCPVHETNEIDSEESKQPITRTSSLVLNRKIPPWHDPPQYSPFWYLNRRDRMLVRSVKNFTLVAGKGEIWGVHDGTNVILKFEKLEDNIYLMDYRYPLSAFQAFAICLSSFG